MNTLTMHSEKCVFTGQTKTGKEILIRYPSVMDVADMWSYINTISNERTFVRFQGEVISAEDEKKYLLSQLDKIAKRQSILLLGFHEQKLIAMASIEMQSRTNQHIGALHISVAKKFRGEGIGSLLMQSAMDEAVKRMPTLEIITFCVFSNNTVGRKMYHNFGFIEYGLLPNGVKLEDGYADRILMYKLIKKT